MRTCAIVNPVAGGGRVRRVWPRVLSRLLAATTSLSVRWTTGPGTATSLTRRALNDGFDRVVAVGGDGTLHEVVNGFFENQSPIAPSAVLVFVACGSGSDFRRTLGVPTGVDAVRQLHSGRIEPLDVLRVGYTAEHDRRARRHAINIASAGLSGTVVRRFASGLLPIPARLRYLRAALRALATDRPVPVRLTLDGESLPPTRVRLVAVANGHTFAAGLPIAPTATPQDGVFDVTVLHDLPVPTVLRHAHRFYLGTHTALDGVTTHRGRRLTVEPLNDRPVWMEADGEALGTLPMTVEIVPKALRVQY
ncbi:MAG: diacylglycerol kinase family protein [Salinibacter sp.]